MGRSKRAPRSERQTTSEHTPVGIHIATGAVAVVAALAVAATLPASPGLVRLAPITAVVFMAGLLTVDAVAVAAIAVLAYLLFIGFLVNQFGVLSWHGSPDSYRLLAIAIPAGAGLLVGAGRRHHRRPPALTVPPEWSAVVPRDPRALTSINKEEFPGA